MTMTPPSTVSQAGTSPNRKNANTEENTGSNSLMVAMKEALSNFNPQLKTLCPSSVQNTASPAAAQRFSGA